MKNSILGSLESTGVEELRAENARLRDRLQWFVLEFAIRGFEVIDEPEKVVTRTVPARLEVRRVKR